MKGSMSTELGLSQFPGSDCEICRICCCGVFRYRRNGCSEYERWIGEAAKKESLTHGIHVELTEDNRILTSMSLLHMGSAFLLLLTI